jgi:hypothetical protein
MDVILWTRIIDFGGQFACRFEGPFAVSFRFHRECANKVYYQEEGHSEAELIDPYPVRQKPGELCFSKQQDAQIDLR